ncbi:hypothetical protein F5146DRAFT_1002651 [Armillaria mellea]|nr:hypothetical protein F5146DRAFT_1002651 [Armillaria mellea]
MIKESRGTSIWVPRTDAATPFSSLEAHQCGDHGVENLYTTQWIENYRGLLSKPYIWGWPSVQLCLSQIHSQYPSRTYVGGDIEELLEGSYRLDHNDSAHIWLLQRLFLAKIDEHAQLWMAEWNNHKIPLEGKHPESPYNMWIESQLMDGMQGLEHVAPTDPHRVDPFGAMPNMGVNYDILILLQQCHHALTPDILAHLDDGRANALLLQDLLSVPAESLAYVPCEPPNCPLTLEEVDILDHTIAASPGMGDDTDAGHRILWIHALQTLNAIIAHRRG